LLGEIEFVVEASGKEIGHFLHKIKHDKYLDMVEILARKEAMGNHAFLDYLTFESPSRKLVKSMWKNREDKFCDISFTFSENEEKKAFAHKSVLISVSDVFEAHFLRKDYRDGDSVNIVDTNFYFFNKLLEFIYTDNVQFTNLDVAFELLYLSKKYLLPNLEFQCQETITNHYYFNHECLFDLLIFNHKSNDKYVLDYLTDQIKQDTRAVLNSEDFLKCDYATVEWILSMEELFIDEWSILCSLYKWAWHNQVNALCDDPNDSNKEVNMECLHGLLECIQFGKIDGESLGRFFNLPKLGEMVNIDEIKQRAFDSLLQDVSGFKRSYSAFRGSHLDDDNAQFYVEIIVKEDMVDTYFEESPLNILHLKDGVVLGLKVKMVPDLNPLHDKYAVVLYTSFQLLCANNIQMGNAINVEILIRDFGLDWRGELKIGEPEVLKGFLTDYRDLLSEKIETLGIENGSESPEEKVLGFELTIGSFDSEENNSD